MYLNQRWRVTLISLTAQMNFPTRCAFISFQVEQKRELRAARPIKKKRISLLKILPWKAMQVVYVAAYSRETF